MNGRRSHLAPIVGRTPEEPAPRPADGGERRRAAIPRSGIYTGVMMHHRETPADHVFRYPVCFYVIDLDELDELDGRLRLFGYNRPAVVSLRDGDHLGDPSRPIKENLTVWLAERGVDVAGGRILMLTNLRTLGYVFNPVTFFYCYRPDGTFACAVAEVANTFGERHPYLLDGRNLVADGASRTWSADKRMHVSPFFGMEQRYAFRLTEPGERVSARVDLFEGDRRVFVATQSGRRQDLTDRALGRALLRYPLMSQQVIGLIHLEALKLWRKHVPFHQKPAFDVDRGSLPAASAHGYRAPDAGSPTPPSGDPRPALRAIPDAPWWVPTGPARRATMWALGQTTGGEITLRTPEGSVRHLGAPAAGRRARVDIRGKGLYRRLTTRGRVGIGEAYTAGDWEADDLAAALEILVRTAHALRDGPVGRAFTRMQGLRPHLPRAAGLHRARRDIQYHYDLGNDLYRLFLDASMTYSCAYFEGPGDTLETAQENKYRRICEKLHLGPDDHVLEIGSGWGGFAIHAAREHGARVTGLTLSDEQHALATERAAAAGVADRVGFRLEDYRVTEGRFSAVASIEMLEAVGEPQLGAYFGAVDRLLAPGGTACIQTIAVPDQQFRRYRRHRDWIQTHIFPGSLIPSLEAIMVAVRRSSGLIVTGVEEIGINYADTLGEWLARFDANVEAVRELGYDERFIRTWRFYLAFCEAAFRSRALHVYQLQFSRPFNDRRPRFPSARVTL